MTGWNKESMESRIRDGRRHSRYEAGCPDAAELEVYARVMAQTGGRKLAVVLGMTPELRQLALMHFECVQSFDHNDLMIRTYRDWVDKENASRESIVQATWFSLPEHLGEESADLVCGDGVPANLPDIRSHRELFALLRSVLCSGGRLVLRATCIPADFERGRYRSARLIERYRCGQLNGAEFGFAMRKLGYLEEAYDPETCVLDNVRVFELCRAARDCGELTEEEYALVHHYYFAGPNILLPEKRLVALLDEAGLDVEVIRSVGRDWYSYYPVFACKPVAGVSAECR